VRKKPAWKNLVALLSFLLLVIPGIYSEVTIVLLSVSTKLESNSATVNNMLNFDVARSNTYWLTLLQDPPCLHNFIFFS